MMCIGVICLLKVTFSNCCSVHEQCRALLAGYHRALDEAVRVVMLKLVNLIRIDGEESIHAYINLWNSLPHHS